MATKEALKKAQDKFRKKRKLEFETQKLFPISREDSLQLLEEMQEDLDKICPYCNGINLWRRGKPKGKTRFPNSYRYECNECGKFFTLNPVNPKLKGDVAKFVMNNLSIISAPDLSELVRKYFKISVSAQTIYLFKRLNSNGYKKNNNPR